MTADERIAQLERDLADERAERRRLAAMVEQMVMAQIAREREEQSAKATRRARNVRHRSVDVSDAVSSASPETSHETSHSPSPSSSPFPSSFPPSPTPSSPYPLSFPPSSPPPPSASPSAEALVLTPAAPGKKPRKEPKEPDTRHQPLVKALVGSGFPFDGGKDAAHVTALLALADQRPETAGEAAPAEVLRRASIGWTQFPAYHSARTLSALRSKWGDLGERAATGRGPAPPSDFSAPAREYTPPAWLDETYGKETEQ